MICPYIRESETTVQQWTKDTDTEEHGQTITKTTFTMRECPKEGCAVWRDGQCWFYGEQDE